MYVTVLGLTELVLKSFWCLGTQEGGLGVISELGLSLMTLISSKSLYGWSQGLYFA
jgi:hypothetical protein